MSQKNRIVNDWMKKTGYTGERGSVWKDHSDGRREKMVAADA